MTLREKAIQEAVRAITQQRREFQRRWVEGGMLHAALPATPNELVARAAFDAFVAAIMEPDEAMIRAGMCAPVQHPERDNSLSRHERTTSAIYQAMIRKLMGDRG